MLPEGANDASAEVVYHPVLVAGICLALPLVVEEGKDLVFPDRPADAAAELVVTVFVPEQATLGGVSFARRRIEGHDRAGPFQR